MRIRYERTGMNSFAAECDLSEKEARKRFNELKQDGRCKWAELVSEDNRSYMHVIDSFDHTNIANTICELFI